MGIARSAPERHRRRRRGARVLAAILALSVVAGACGFLGNGDDARVDLAKPRFSDPTVITNPRFPVTELNQVIQLGEERGSPARVEITLLPDTKVIEWNGTQIETAVSQFVGYRGGRIVEVATDYFAQADDGSVWYLGEHVDNYKDGVIANHGGSWLAGRDGTGGMIMPASPRVGDVFRPEDIPGVVFEEVVVQETGETVQGPQGPIKGAVVTTEHLMEGTSEEKVWAPGYGEFRARAADELITVAVAAPTDALPGPVPKELTALQSGAIDVFAAALTKDWGRVTVTVDALNRAWDSLGVSQSPELLQIETTDALDRLVESTHSREVGRVRQGAIDVARCALDLQLRYRTPVVIDLARLDLWARQILVDAADDDLAAVAGDVATLKTIRDRVAHTMEPNSIETIDRQLADLRSAADSGDLSSAATVSKAIQTTLATVAVK